MLNSLESSLSSLYLSVQFLLFARLFLCIVFKVRFALPGAPALGRARIEYQIRMALSSTFFGKFQKKKKNFFASVQSVFHIQNRSPFGGFSASFRCDSFPFVRTDLSRLTCCLPYFPVRRYPDTVPAPSVSVSGSTYPPRLPVFSIHPAAARMDGMSAGSRHPFSPSIVPGPG